MKNASARPKRAIVSYATADYRETQIRLMSVALRFGITICFAYTKNDLHESDFYVRNRFILGQPRGTGYWLWKPFFILEALKCLDEGDELLYCDAGVELIAPLDMFFDVSLKKGDIGLYSSKGYVNKVWTKRDAFIFFDADSPRYWDTEQVAGGIVLLRKSAFSIKFVSEWLEACTHENVIMDGPSISGFPELPQFRAHRHDQSVLTILATKHNITPHRHPSQHGNGIEKDFPGDAYPQICTVQQSRPFDRGAGIFLITIGLRKAFCEVLKNLTIFLKLLFLLPVGLWNSVRFRLNLLMKKS